MICKQCKRTVSTEEMALSGYTRQDGTKSRRNICKVCANMNRYTAQCIRQGLTSLVDDCMQGYKTLIDLVYNGVISDSTLPSSILQTYKAKFKVKSTDDHIAGEVNPLHVFMDAITDGGYTAELVQVSYDDMIINFQIDKCDGPTESILSAFLQRMSKVTDEKSLDIAVEMLYQSSILDSTQQLCSARTDIRYPEVFLSYLFEAAENIYDEESFSFFGYQVYPKAGTYWTSLYERLNQICGVQAITV